MRTVLVLLFAFLLCGAAKADGFLLTSLAREAVVDTILIRRAVVGNDWVYVKATDTLHRRYIPTKGFWVFRLYKGNKALASVGRITKLNKNIIVYGNLAKAQAEQPKAKISEESKAFVDKDTKKPRKAPEWWTKRLKEKAWQPGD